MTTIPEGAFFVSPVRSENSGIDFLRLGAVGERLIAAGLPGITNVTRYLKPHTVAAWIVWRFNENLKAHSVQHHKLPANVPTLFKAFREKAELLFSWSNRGTVGAIGNSRAYPDSLAPLTLSFSNSTLGPLNRASWFAAAAYGPSFAEAGGLGYIAAHKSVYVATPLGEKAARVLDELMSLHPTAHGRISHLLEHEGSQHDVAALGDALRLEATSANERDLFKQALFPEEKVGVWDMMHGNRATTIALILGALERTSPMSVESIRQTIALGHTPDGAAIVDSRLDRMRRLWFAVCIRQLQRVAMEKLLRWFELKLFDMLGRWCDIDVVCNALTRTLQETWAPSAELTVGASLEGMCKAIVDAGGLWQAPLNDPRVNQFALREELEQLSDAKSADIPSRAIYALLMCSAVTQLSQVEPELPQMFQIGQRERVSLATLDEFACSRANETLAAFARDVLTHLVYAQHLQTAASRVEAGKNKFRFATDDQGLRPLIAATSVNAQLGTPDRLLHALYLMDECRLIRKDADLKFWLY